MKKRWLIFLLLFPLLIPPALICQVNEDLKLPKLEDVERIEISNTSNVNWYKPEELLKLLPKFVASEGTYVSKTPLQRGTFILKNGKKITWMAAHANSILLYEGSKEQLYVLPKEEKKKQPAAAGPLFAIWDADGKAGFIDIEGNIVLKPTEEVRQFSEGLAPVKIGDKWGYADLTGKVVIAPRWKTYNEYNAPVTAFSEGLAAVFESAQGYSSDDNEYWTYECGYIDRTGEYVIKPVRRQWCGPFHEGRAAIKVDPRGPEKLKTVGDIGYIDAKGNLAIAPKFYEAGDFMNGYALVNEDWDEYPRLNSYLVDKNGNKAAGVKDCRWRYRFSDGLALAFSAKEKRYDGYINENCEYVIKLPAGMFADLGASYFSQGLAAVYKQRALLPTEESYSAHRPKTWGYIDVTGKIAIPIQYKNAGRFSEGFAIVGREMEGDTYIDLKGNVAFGKTISKGTFENGLAFQMLHLWTIGEKPNARNIYGYMNKQGKYVWLSPRAENYLSKEWILENYVGPQKFNFPARP